MPSEPAAVRTVRVPLSVPHIAGNEARYLQECLDTNWVSSGGPFVTRFERLAADYIGRRHAVAVMNGTSALHTALLVAGVEPGDEVLMPSLTFIAPANAVRYIGAKPVFIDAEPEFLQIDPQKLADFIARECRWRDGTLRNASTGSRIRAILPVDVVGHPADMAPILDLARRFDLVVVEDATEAAGSRYRDEPVGRRADLTCLSFNGNKIVTAGGGGMVLTDNDEWATRARYLTTQAKDDPIEFVHASIGFNYRLTNIQAAVGVAQFERLDEYVAIKRGIAARYAAALTRSGIAPMAEAPWAFSNFWLYTIRVNEQVAGFSSRALMHRLDAASIDSRPLWQPLHLSPAHADCQAYACDVAERLHEVALSLPCSVGLTASEQQRVIDAIQCAR